MTYDFKENRQIRIFISSTFRDMMDERSYLVTRIFPELRRYCEERDISLFELDLRWGVTQEESENQMAFKICLNEVDNTNPFFIGLLGERYGWVPDEETREKMRPTKVFDEYEWLLDELKNKKSITEAEIHEGAFKPDEVNAYFYIRSPVMHTPDEFREDKGSHGEKMLLELKNRIRNDTRYSVKDYESVENLGEKVEKDFKALVDSLFPEKRKLTSLEKERMQQYVFLKSKTRSYVENKAWYSFLDNFAQSGESAAAVTGERGIGKNALLANWILNRAGKKIPNEKIIYHFTGITQSGGDYQKILRRLIEEINDYIYNCDDEDEPERQSLSKNKDSSKQKSFIPFIFKLFSSFSSEQNDKLQNELKDLFLDIPKDKKLIIVLGCIDRLVDTENSKMLNWIPETPENVKFIFSSVSGDKSMEALSRRVKQMLVVQTQDIETRKKIIAEYYKKYSKKMDIKQTEMIINSKKSENPLVLLSILDNLRIFGNFDIFEKQIEERLSQESNENLFDLLLRDIESIFNNGSKNENVKINPVKDILSLIAVSRRGLTETEIINISKIPKLYWSQLSNCMTAHLLTINGYVTFSSMIMQSSVKNRYLTEKEVENHYRSEIREYMESGKEVTFIRRCEELPFQLMELKEWDKLYNLLASHDVFNFIFEKDIYELGKYWRALRLNETKRYSMEIYLEYKGDDNDELIHFYHRVCMLLFTFNDFETGMKVARKTEELCNKLNVINLDNLNMMAGCFNGTGDYENAVKYYKKALLLNDKYKEKNKENYYNDKLMFLSGIGNNYKHLQNYKEAITYLYDALELSKNTHGEDNPGAAALYDSIGMCYEDLGDYIKAHDHYCYSLTINEKHYGKDHISSELTYNNFGSVFMKMGKYEDAARDFLKAININRKYYTVDHPNVVESINNLGACMTAMGDYKQALTCYNNALNINRKLFGIEHKTTAQSCDNIGSCYYALDDIQNAFNYYRDALIIKEKILGKEHPDTAPCYNNIAKCFFSFKQIDDALEAFNTALNILENSVGINHPYTAYIYNQLASCYYSLGIAGKSLEYYEKAMSIYIYLEGFDEQVDNIKIKIEELKKILKGGSNA